MCEEGYKRGGGDDDCERGRGEGNEKERGEKDERDWREAGQRVERGWRECERERDRERQRETERDRDKEGMIERESEYNNERVYNMHDCVTSHANGIRGMFREQHRVCFVSIFGNLRVRIVELNIFWVKVSV